MEVSAGGGLDLHVAEHGAGAGVRGALHLLAGAPPGATRVVAGWRQPLNSEKNSSTKNQINNLKKPSSREISSKEPDAKPKIGDAVVPKTDGKMLRAISIARKLNPKVSF